MNQEKQPDAIKLANQADTQLDRIDRYLDKNWLDDDYPDDKIYAALVELRRLHAKHERYRTALNAIAAIEDKEYGADWEEIKEAREIAETALKADKP